MSSKKSKTIKQTGRVLRSVSFNSELLDRIIKYAEDTHRKVSNAIAHLVSIALEHETKNNSEDKTN